MTWLAVSQAHGLRNGEQGGRRRRERLGAGELSGWRELVAGASNLS